MKCSLNPVFLGMEHNFRKIATLNQGTPYDYNSVMQYHRWVASLQLCCVLRQMCGLCVHNVLWFILTFLFPVVGMPSLETTSPPWSPSLTQMCLLAMLRRWVAMTLPGSTPSTSVVSVHMSTLEQTVHTHTHTHRHTHTASTLYYTYCFFFPNPPLLTSPLQRKPVQMCRQTGQQEDCLHCAHWTTEAADLNWSAWQSMIVQ